MAPSPMRETSSPPIETCFMVMYLRSRRLGIALRAAFASSNARDTDRTRSSICAWVPVSPPLRCCGILAHAAESGVMSLSFLATRWVTLETERLTLRMLRDSDVDAYAEMVTDPEIMRFIGDGKPISREFSWRSVAAMIGHWHLRGYGYWAAVERSTGQLVGRVGFWNPEGWPGFELGWMLRKRYWGQGFATEGARAAR